jgi:hypothetical protein
VDLKYGFNNSITFSSDNNAALALGTGTGVEP